MISIDGAPVAFIGATRWYATPFLESLTEPEERAAIVALCDAMTAPQANRGALQGKVRTRHGFLSARSVGQ